MEKCEQFVKRCEVVLKWYMGGILSGELVVCECTQRDLEPPETTSAKGQCEYGCIDALLKGGRGRWPGILWGCFVLFVF